MSEKSLIFTSSRFTQKYEKAFFVEQNSPLTPFLQPLIEYVILTFCGREGLRNLNFIKMSSKEKTQKGMKRTQKDTLCTQSNQCPRNPRRYSGYKKPIPGSPEHLLTRISNYLNRCDALKIDPIKELGQLLFLVMVSNHKLSTKDRRRLNLAFKVIEKLLKNIKYYNEN